MALELQHVNFFSDSLKIAGIMALPEGDGPYPGIVIPQGTVGLKEHYRSPEICIQLARAGYAALTFDYRGFGESEGPREEIVPLAQVQDIRDALTYLSTQPRVDTSRLGLLGFCWGGTHSIYVGAIDPRVQCVVTAGAIGDGTRWLHSLRSCWEWKEFLRRIDADRINRVLTGSSERVRFGEVVIGSPKAKEGRQRIIAEIAPASPPYRTADVTLQTAERILEYSPEQLVARIAPRPLLVIHGAEDDLAPVEEAEALYAAAGEPKKLVVFPNAWHHDVYLDPLFHDVMQAALEWFEKWLAIGVDRR